MDHECESCSQEIFIGQVGHYRRRTTRRGGGVE